MDISSFDDIPIQFLFAFIPYIFFFILNFPTTFLFTMYNLKLYLNHKYSVVQDFTIFIFVKVIHLQHSKYNLCVRYKQPTIFQVLMKTQVYLFSKNKQLILFLMQLLMINPQTIYSIQFYMKGVFIKSEESKYQRMIFYASQMKLKNPPQQNQIYKLQIVELLFIIFVTLVQFKIRRNYKMKRQQLSEIQESPTERLKRNIQSVSSLYEDQVLKKKRQSKQKVQVEKIKILYEHQKAQKMNSLRLLDEARRKIKVMQVQNQTLKFAYRALEVRIRKQKKSRLEINKKVIQRTLRTDKKMNSYKRNSIKKKSGVRFKQTPLESNDQIKQNVAYQNVFETNQIQTKFQDSLKQLNQQIKYKNYDKFPSEHDLPTQKLIQQIQEKNRVNEKNELKIVELQQKFDEMQVQIEKLKEQLQQKNKKIINIQDTLKEKQLDILKLQNDYKEVLIDLKESKRKYQQRQIMEQREVSLLKKFGEDLKIQDKKIKQFIKQQLGVQGEHITEKIAYKEKISYLLHLASKKDDLYEAVIKDLKEKNRQNHYRIKIMEQKLDNYTKFN